MTSCDWTLQRDPPQVDFLAFAGKQLWRQGLLPRAVCITIVDVVIRWSWSLYNMRGQLLKEHLHDLQEGRLHHDRRCCHTMCLVIMPFVIQILHVLVVDLIRSPRRRTSTMPRPRQERAMLFDERRTLEVVTVSSHFMDILHVVFWWLYSNLSSEGHDVEYLAIVSGDLGYLFLGMVNSKGFTFNIIILNFI